MGVSNGGGGGEPDLLTAANGGSEFAARLAQLITVRTEAAQALEQLNLGKQARAAFEEAHSQLTMAKGAVASAKEQGDTYISEAKKQAADIVANAERVAEQLTSEASNMRQESLNLKIVATEHADKAAEIKAEVEMERAHLQKLSQAAIDAKALHDDKIKRIHAAINS